MLPRKGSKWNLFLAAAWFIVTLAGSTVFISTVGHYGWHWAPLCIAVEALGTVFFFTRFDV